MNDYTALIQSGPLVMIEFYATWCGHCRAMMPVVSQIRELVGTTVGIYQIDIDAQPETAQECGITGTPTFILYRDGREIWRHDGEIEGNALLKTIEGAMA